jgi:hypothetical protein
MVGIGSIWLRIGTDGGIMWRRWWTSGFHKMLGSSRVAAQLATSQEGLSSMSEWVSDKAFRAHSLHNLQIFLPGVFVCTILLVRSNLEYASVVWNSLSRPQMPISLSGSIRSLRPSVFIVFSPYVPCTYTVDLDKLILHFLRKRRHDLDALFFCSGL